MCNSNKEKNFKSLVLIMEKEIEKALPSNMSSKRFTRVILTLLKENPKLNECTQESFLLALMHCAQLGLEPDSQLGHAYIIPRKNKRRGVLEADVQVGYKGMLELAYRSNQFLNIYSQEICENDIFECEYGSTPKLIHKPNILNRSKVIGFYGFYKLKNGASYFEIMSKEDMKEFAKDNTFNFESSNSTWNKDFNEMAKKTMIKKVLKYAPSKVQFQNESKGIESVFYETIPAAENTNEDEQKKGDKKEE